VALLVPADDRARLLTQAQAVAGVDFNTLALLIGMMLIVAIARRSGIFQYVAILAAQATAPTPPVVWRCWRGHRDLLGFLDNVTTCCWWRR